METKIRKSFYGDTVTSRADIMPFDVIEGQVKNYATPKYDLSRLEDRQRCWYSHLISSYGGGIGPWCQVYDVDRSNFEAWLRGEAMDDQTRKRLASRQDEFNELAANDEFWARLNVLGASNAK